MSELHACPHCGERLIATARHLDHSVRCPACRADFVLRAGPVAAAPRHSDDFELPVGTGRPSVPPPRVSQSGRESTMLLALAAASLLLWPMAPVIWWLARRTGRDLAAQGSEIPSTVRTAVGLSIAGTTLLVLVLVCATPALLVL